MADIIQDQTSAEEALRTAFQSLPTGDAFYPSRAAAFEAFSSRGLPTRKVEEWHYTNLKRFMDAVPPLSTRLDVDTAKKALDDIESTVEGVRLPFVNGHFFAELADPLPEGVRVVSFAEAIRQSDNLERFVAPGEMEKTILDLNAAFAQDGLAIVVEKGVSLDVPLKIWHVSTGLDPVLSAMRHSVVVEEGAQCTFIERYATTSDAAYQTNAVTNLHVQSNAQVTYIRDQQESLAALHLSALVARVEDEVSFTPFSYTSGASVSRMESHFTFAGEGTVGAVKGVTLINGNQHADHTMVVDHAAPGCESTEQFNSVLLGEATSVFQGKIGVRQIAQKTDAKMMSRALILSDDATFNTKPELEIFADDVACGHGATIADIDDEPLFYLMARGIKRGVAERMLVEAFLSELIDELENEALRDTLNGYVHAYFEKGMGA